MLVHFTLSTMAVGHFSAVRTSDPLQLWLTTLFEWHEAAVGKFHTLNWLVRELQRLTNEIKQET
ncbi:hypothetical protein Mapa_013248 [Marchantia paleacea]|nr:hypothetical protein Mapa_013248 [Marchantia paleacea]